MNIISNHKSQLFCARGLWKCGICDELLKTSHRKKWKFLEAKNSVWIRYYFASSTWGFLHFSCLFFRLILMFNEHLWIYIVYIWWCSVMKILHESQLILLCFSENRGNICALRRGLGLRGGKFGTGFFHRNIFHKSFSKLSVNLTIWFLRKN